MTKFNKEQYTLNLNADRLEGLIYNCDGCKHEIENKESYNDNCNSSLSCGSKICKYKIEYQEILKQILNRTQTM